MKWFSFLTHCWTIFVLFAVAFCSWTFSSADRHCYIMAALSDDSSHSAYSVYVAQHRSVHRSFPALFPPSSLSLPHPSLSLALTLAAVLFLQRLSWSWRRLCVTLACSLLFYGCRALIYKIVLDRLLPRLFVGWSRNEIRCIAVWFLCWEYGYRVLYKRYQILPLENPRTQSIHLYLVRELHQILRMNTEHSNKKHSGPSANTKNKHKPLFIEEGANSFSFTRVRY